jgi:NADH-quinone oxidoreductase subunit L
MGACSYYLISHHWELAEARTGAVKAFLVTRLGDVGLLFGIFVLGDATGTYRISGVLEAAASGGITGSEATLASLLVLCGVVGKSAQFPLHTWLPDAMPGPTPISALIHAATMVAAGVFLVARLLAVFELSDVAMGTLAVVAATTMLGAALMALAADDLKRVLAWSTVSQLALMFGALSIGGYDAGVLHLLAHGAFKALLFLAAGSVIHAVGTQRIDSMGGLRTAMPVTFATMTVGFAALAGLPPFVGFFSKDEVLGLAAEHAFDGVDGFRPWLLLVVGYLTAAVTAAYATRAWLMVFFGPRRRAAYAVAPHESPALMRWPLVVLAVASTFGGLAVVFPHFLGVEHDPHWWMFLVSSFVVLAAVGFTTAEWSRLGRSDPAGFLGVLRRPAAAEFGLDRLMVTTATRLTGAGSRVVVANEAAVVEPYVAGSDAGAQWAGRALRWLHNGNIQRYVTAVVVGALAVAVLVGVMQG